MSYTFYINKTKGDKVLDHLEGSSIMKEENFMTNNNSPMNLKDYQGVSNTNNNRLNANRDREDRVTSIMSVQSNYIVPNEDESYRPNAMSPRINLEYINSNSYNKNILQQYNIGNNGNKVNSTKTTKVITNSVESEGENMDCINNDNIRGNVPQSNINNILTSNFSFEKFIKKSNSALSVVSPSKAINGNTGLDYPPDIKTAENIVQEEEYQENTNNNIEPGNSNTIDPYNNSNNRSNFVYKTTNPPNDNPNYIPDKNLTRNYSTLNKVQTKNNVQLYLERRHLQEVEKLNQIRFEKMRKEAGELRDRPKINENSKKLIENKIKDKVFDRLTDKKQFRRRAEEIKIIENINNKDKCPHEPRINKSSQKCQRGVKDLYDWQRKKEEKRMEREQKCREEEYQPNPNISPASEGILREVNPGYLEKKVEDRLLEKGQKSKNKIEVMKEEIFQQITKGNSNNTSHTKSNGNKSFISMGRNNIKEEKESNNNKAIPVMTENAKIVKVQSHHRRTNSESNNINSNNNQGSNRITHTQRERNNTSRSKDKQITTITNNKEDILRVRKQLHMFLDAKGNKNEKNETSEQRPLSIPRPCKPPKNTIINITSMNTPTIPITTLPLQQSNTYQMRDYMKLNANAKNFLLEKMNIISNNN